MADLSQDEVQSLGRAVGLTIDGPLLTEVTYNLNALKDLLESVNPPGLDQVEPLPIVPPYCSSDWKSIGVSRCSGVRIGVEDRRPLARAAMSARVKESRCSRMWDPTSAHTVSSTHWPSWSHAPFWWGSPKSPAAMGPSTAPRW